MEYYDYYDSGKYKALRKNMFLVAEYESFKNTMCGGVGQRKIKLFLNKKIKEGDKIAELYRTALETENTNINAKKYKNTSSVSYKDVLYDRKEEMLIDLIKLCIDYNKTIDKGEKIIFGYENTNNHSTNLILYFELPYMEQISFHCNIPIKDYPDVIKYPGKWDGKENSTLFKIEDSIMKRYGEDIKTIKKINKYIKI